VLTAAGVLALMSCEVEAAPMGAVLCGAKT
jgi:hypothetical protein